MREETPLPTWWGQLLKEFLDWFPASHEGALACLLSNGPDLTVMPGDRRAEQSPLLMRLREADLAAWHRLASVFTAGEVSSAVMAHFSRLLFPRLINLQSRQSL